MTSKMVSAWSSCGAVDDLLQQCLRTGVEEGDPAQEKCLVLPHDQWSPRRRSFHEPDSHCRTVRRKSVRLSHGVTAASPRTGASARELDALELPGKPCSGDGYCRLSGQIYAATHACHKLTAGPASRGQVVVGADCATTK